MSIKKLSRKRPSQPSNLTIRMAEDRMASDRMVVDRGLGSVPRPSQPLSGPTNSLQRSEDVDQENSSEKK